MILIKIESLSRKELEYIAIQEGIQDASSLTRDELIETLKEIYEDDNQDETPFVQDSVQRKFVTWLTDYRGEGSEVTSLPGVEELPELYSGTSIHILTKNATWIYCYWSISPLDAEKFATEYPGYKILLNVRLSENGNVVDVYDIAVEESDVQWSINVNNTRGSAQVNLVLQDREGERHVIAESESIALVYSYWLENPEAVRENKDLIRRQLSLVTNREGVVLSCETVEGIVRIIKDEEASNG